MKWKLTPRLISLLVVLGVFVAALAARHMGILQFLEFRLYDYFLRQAPNLSTGDPIVLVEMTESDIQESDLDYPITDEKLAELLEKLASAGPSVIGLDIWRDIPVPKSGVHLPKLNSVLLARTNILGIYTATSNGPGISPPEALLEFPDRVAFNDNFLVDEGVEKTTPKVRRSLLFLPAESGHRLDALPFRVACMHLGASTGHIPANPSEFQFGKAKLRPLREDAGPYVRADALGMQMLLDFKHPANFSRFSFSQAFAGEIPVDALRGKIILVGINAPSVADERVTPIRYSHRGIELQAITILQLLRWASEGGQSLRYAPDWLEDGWMLAWCILGGLIGYRSRSPWRFVASILLSLAALGLVAQFAFSIGWWVPSMSPAAAFLPAAAMVTSYISYQEHRNRSHLMQLFSNQVSPDIAQALWEQRDAFLAGGRPRSQKLIATVVFTDLKGFSSTSEGMDPEVLMDWLNEYMEVMANAVMAHQGVVEKYIGDAIMAVFGVPVPRTSQVQIAQDARNAVRCAIVMGREMEQLNAHWKERGLPVCSTRVGIHTGPLVAGSLGSSERQEYTVIGDSVNTASRLESFEKDSPDPNLRDDHHCRILISEATRSLLGEEFNLVPVGAISLKGKSEKVTVFRVRDA